MDKFCFDCYEALLFLEKVQFIYPLHKKRTLNIHKTFRRCRGCHLNVLCMFNLPPVSRGGLSISFIHSIIFVKLIFISVLKI